MNLHFFIISGYNSSKHQPQRRTPSLSWQSGSIHPWMSDVTQWTKQDRHHWNIVKSIKDVILFCLFRFYLMRCKGGGGLVNFSHVKISLLLTKYGVSISTYRPFLPSRSVCTSKKGLNEIVTYNRKKIFFGLVNVFSYCGLKTCVWQ